MTAVIQFHEKLHTMRWDGPQWYRMALAMLTDSEYGLLLLCSDPLVASPVGKTHWNKLQREQSLLSMKYVYLLFQQLDIQEQPECERWQAGLGLVARPTYYDIHYGHESALTATAHLAAMALHALYPRECQLSDPALGGTAASYLSEAAELGSREYVLAMSRKDRAIDYSAEVEAYYNWLNTLF